VKQRRFEQLYRPEWDILTRQLERLESRRGKGDMDNAGLADLPGRYRRLCHQQALARQRGYSVGLTTELDGLMLRAHRQLYTYRPPILSRLRRFLVHDFPVAVREQAAWNLISTAVFVLSSLLVFILIQQQPDMVFSVMNEDTVDQLEQMYGQGSLGSRGARTSGDDATMFGFYIMNNIGVAFRSFASGIFFGVGALFIMLFNGSYLGAAASHLTNLSFGDSFYSFVIAHGAPELTAIVLAGGCGLRLGWALVSPGRFARIEALRQAAQGALPVLYGVIVLLLAAAFIEAFWSPRDLPLAIKYGVGATLWCLLLIYLFFGGRRMPGGGR
jgi:uncharacterized membrane protein SpoIIM required for sporulation